jgi:hypothetical protein
VDNSNPLRLLSRRGFFWLEQILGIWDLAVNSGHRYQRGFSVMGFPFFFAQTVDPPPSVPAPAGDLLNGFEQLIIDTFRSAVDSVFRSDQYTLWVALVTVLASWLFFNRLIVDFAKGFLTGKGSLKNIIQTTALMFFNFFLVLNPKIIGEAVFSLFEFLMAVGNGFILGPTGQSLDLTGEIGQVAQSMADASGVNAFNAMYGIAWLLVAIATTLLCVLYFVHLIMAFFQIYIIFPLLLRFGQTGLFMKETQGWFYSLVGSALEQLLIPLLGKLSIGVTFLLMDILFKRISAQQGVAVVQNVANNLETIMTFVFLLAMGLVLQFNVPKLAKIFGISASGAAKDIAGTGAAAGLFIAALKPAIGIAKLPISAPAGAVRGALGVPAKIRRAQADVRTVRQTTAWVKSKFVPKSQNQPGPRTPRPD